MPCERVEQPLSHSALEDTGAPAPMEIMMARSLEDICLLACSPQSLGTHGGPRAAPSREGEPEPRGHMAPLEMPRAGSRSTSRGDTWRPRSCPQPGGRSRCLDLKLVRGGTRSSGYRHRYIGSFPILEKCGTEAYKLMSPSLAGVHDIFHVSQLKKCLKAPVDVVLPEVTLLEADLSYPEHPIKVLDQKDGVTRRKTIKFFKI
jgi:hypothetical protein